MDSNFLSELYTEHQKALECPSPIRVTRFFKKVLGFLFPEHSEIKYENEIAFEAEFAKLKSELLHILSRRSESSFEQDKERADYIFSELPKVREMLVKDVEAIYMGDPAARNHDEVIRTYPGFYAIAAYRIAHLFHTLDMLLIARIISSHAHNKTGIDIHPGANIGSHFCIDHGTGVVIGETTDIGNHVKLYQGVTLGALSVDKEDAKTKRHPNIEDHVVIYAGATILGGKTTVGHHTVIGGNVWLTESVAPHSRLYYESKLVQKGAEL